MFGFLKKNVNAEMKNLVAVATLVNALEINRHFLMLVKQPSSSYLPPLTSASILLSKTDNWYDNITPGNENDVCMQLASATTNYLFNNPFNLKHIEMFTKEVIVDEAMAWLDASDSLGDKNFCKLVVQSLRVLNTLEYINNKDSYTKIIGEDILTKYGKNYSDEPNPKTYKQLISDLASFNLSKDDLNAVTSFAKKHNINL